MPDPQRRLILANGEQYAEPVSKPPSSRPTEPPRSYDEARTLVRNGLTSAIHDLRELPQQKRLPDEAVFCLRLHPDATAKSYDPIALFEEVPELDNVGSRNYRVSTDKVAKTKRIEKKADEGAQEVDGRLIFVRSSPTGYRRLIDRLDSPEADLSQQFRTEIRRVEQFNALSTTEQILGFETTWREGRAELVFHPCKAPSDGQLRFLFELFDFCGIDLERSRVRQYPNGPAFASCRLTRPMLDLLAGANPLRAAHPLTFGGLEDLRHAPTFPAPRSPASATRSTIKVGMFDGGVDTSNPLLAGHVEEDSLLSTSAPPIGDFVSHGTAVAGALLHGPLNGLEASDRLPPPPVYVVSIRALPTSDPNDIDLYEAIDVVERAVPSRKDIKVFNLSFGPRGPILDDTISRFTYVLDTLAVTHKVTFFTAVGNDGEQVGLDRIQSPSDLVHGMGVGAFTRNGQSPIHAPYSCKGPGRECAKIKPDIVAFGGCQNTPIHLVARATGRKSLSAGTSFATPIAARVGAQATECFERSTALLARALVVHTAVHPEGKPDHLLGHGCVLPKIDDILYCPDPAVTVAFLGDILPTKMVRLPIPLPPHLYLPGMVKVTWTVAALTPIDGNHPSDYTCCCIEDTFYPHATKHKFTKLERGKSRSKTIDVEADASTAAQLLSDGWKRSSFPATVSGNDYRDEHDRRLLDCKWEPLVRRSRRMKGVNLREPFLVLHAISRNRVSERFEYAALVTVEAPKFDGDLYTEIRQRFPALAPIRLRTEAEIRVQI